MDQYDIVTVGGGLGASALARSMAEQGASVLVLERDLQFRDRVRGEGLTTWGSAEARELGIYELLALTCAHEVPWWDNYAGAVQVLHREVPSTTPQGLPTLTFYHPEMQRTLLEAAAAAGAEIRTAARVAGIVPGVRPTVTVDVNGRREQVTARLVVAADGRSSLARKWGGFSEYTDPAQLRISGLLLDECHAPDDTVRFISDFQGGRGAIVFPQGESRARAYLVVRAREKLRLQGAGDVPRFIQEYISIGMPAEFVQDCRAAGPLASFDGADCWAEHPYHDGIALIGDAAAYTDPSWGQGLAFTLRDARLLRDALLAYDDWDVAGHAYASEHDRCFNVVHTVERWFTELFYDAGPDADARRDRALGLAAEDPTRQPDTLISGPDHPVDETMRRRFFGEE